MARILIIDDRPVNRQFLVTLLGYEDHDLREASDGAEGLRIARDQRPELIISDVLMPTMDGYEFVRRLREDPEIGKIPVIFSTAHYLSRESRALAVKCGITSIIYKPCEPQTALDIVASALSGKATPPPAVLTQTEGFDRAHQHLLTNKLSEMTDQLRVAHGKLTALIDLSTELGAERDPVLLLNRYCAVAREIIGARWTLVVLLDRKKKTVRHLGIVGLELEDSPALRAALLKTGVFKTLVNEHRAIRLSDETSTPGSLQLPDSLPRASSLLVVPLSTRGETEGWICLADKLGLDAFEEEDQRLAVALAAKIAIAYDNALLYSVSMKHSAKLEKEILERGKVERQLDESRAQLAGIIDSAMDAIITIDSSQQIVMFNKAAEQMFGCSAVDVMGQTLDRFVPPQFTSSHGHDIRRFAETGVTTRAMGKTPAVKAARADGTEFPVEASISQIEAGGQKLFTVIMRDVTERKRAEEQVRESEQRLQSVIENLSEGLVVADLEGQLLHWNQAALDIHGFTSSEECLRKLPEFASIFELSDLDGGVLELDQWPLARVMRGERLRNFEIRIRRLEGDWNRVFNYGGAPIIQANGSRVAVVTMCDITERKLADADRSLLAALVESSEDAIIGETLDGIVTSWNKGAEKLYGYSAEEAKGQSVWLRTPPDRVNEIKTIMEVRRRGENIQTIETQRLTKEGAIIDVALTISPIKERSGKLIGSSTIARDITKRKRAEEAQTASELRYRRLFESAEDGILIVDEKTGRIVDANPYISASLGYSHAELVGKELWQIGFYRDAEEAQEAFDEVRINGYVRYDDLPLKTRAGLTIEVEVVSNVYLEGDSKVIQCNIRDITERKRAERDLEESNLKLGTTLGELSATTEQLWQASKLATMGELSASIAHELNNPLATVGLRIENLLVPLLPDDPQRHSLEIINHELDRMADLVNNLLQFSRRSHRQVSTVDVADEISKSIDFVHYHLRNHKVDIVREVADPLPTIQADRQQLRQLFLNLLTNASDAMPQGGALTVRAVSGVLDEAEAVQIEFADNGGGIEPEDLKRVWEPFFTTKAAGKGTGLGLAICRRIMEEHGGTIEVESTIGRGTTVRILFPATAKGARTNLE